MPSIFSRFADIINSNLNSMLDKAENPVKMIKLMISEMEDTLAEIKAACAQTMAEQNRWRRRRDEVEEKRDLWLKRATLAAEKDRDDLAKEAILEKRKAEEALINIEEQGFELNRMVEKYRVEIEQLESKIRQAREKEKMLPMRQTQANKSLKASGQMKQYDLSDAQLRLEQIDRQLERLEASAELEFNSRQIKTPSKDENNLEKEFQQLDDSIDRELAAIKEGLQKN